ncbi:endolytic transglycosylase MltG [Mesorhizobium sp. LHD-90]|uniref:endolytic transglycosylase MltG n=1 Tax=Mesorhizobium sp. LHD-90 TaxID=3071414 RepID=UPI0027E15FB2|nr:endolytic transglycosylase MltG [Mesorhizobium sp. LHD-90]MDQ6435094.1 endolytic transglycosylase MltG [Mesorhizobium sp. LHD-90]
MSDTQTSTAEFGRREEPQKPPVAKTASEALRPEKGTPPPVRRSRASRSQIVVFMNFLVSLVILAVVAAGLLVYFGRQAFFAPGPTTAMRTFLVKENSGVGQIGSQLEQGGFITDAVVFRLGLRTYGGKDTLKAGEYEVPVGASMNDIVRLLQSGKSVMHSLTVPEGLTVAQAFRRIADNEALSGAMPQMPPEGSLAADTQRFTRGAQRKAIVEKMQAQQAALIEEIWAKRAPDLPVADVNEFVTLASIVEKETGVDSERPHVASVFVNRLRKKMRLQSDPTIIYGLFGGAGKPADRPIYQSDIEKPTPYNTYVINGLPPTPIANPGRAALEAVANPLQTDDLYFVADGTGGHVFASTLDEHNKNVARWRAVQKQQGQAGTTGEQGEPGTDTAQ